MTSQKRPMVVHVSGDFPDAVEEFKTPVVRSLVDLTASDFSHKVISINRSSPRAASLSAAILRHPMRPRMAIVSKPFDRGTALTYHAPGKGLFHATMLDQLGNWLAGHIAGDALPNLIVAHKLTIEGLAVHRAAEQLGLPYAISIQGDTDAKVLAARPDLVPRLRKVLHHASAVFPFSPWALTAIERKLGRYAGPVFMLPCPTDLDQPTTPKAGGTGLVTAFHLKNYRRKNLAGMAHALKSLDKGNSGIKLTVIGGGNDRDRKACEAIARETGSITFAGAMNRTEVRTAFLGAQGFVMPSLRESFGLVFIEALFAGLPIAYPAGTAVDGYLDGLPFAIRMDARNPESIASAMLQLDRNETELKAKLGEWLHSADSRRFTRPAIADQFRAGLLAAIG